MESYNGVVMKISAVRFTTEFYAEHNPVHTNGRNIKLYKISKCGNYVLLPRFSSVCISKRPISRVSEHYDRVPISFIYEPKDYQRHAIESILRSLRAQRTCYFKMNVGTGKTYVICKVLERIQLPTIILGPNKSCRRSWVTVFDTYSDVKLSSAPQSDKYVYVTYDYALRHREIFKSYAVTVIDEVHNIGTVNRMEILWNSCTKYVIACTATPNRVDGMNAYHSMFIGQLIDLNTITITYNGIIKRYIYQSNIAIDFDIRNIHLTYRYLETDNTRTDIVLNMILSVLPGNVFVFADHVSYLHVLDSKLNTDNDTVCKLIYSGRYASKCLDRLSATKSNVIFTTYKMASESLSITTIFNIVFATPRKSNMDQIVGRITRNNNLNKRIICDIVDMVIPYLYRQYKIRAIHYRELGFKINPFLNI